MSNRILRTLVVGATLSWIGQWPLAAYAQVDDSPPTEHSPPPLVPPPPAVPPPPPEAGAPPPAQPETQKPVEFPSDAFLPVADDPRIPSFLRALRLGADSLLLGGYVQPGFRFVNDTPFNADDSDGFVFENARIIGRGQYTFYEKLGAALRFDFDVASGNFAVRDVYATLFWDQDLVALDVGQLKVPFGLSELQSESKLQFAVGSPTRKLAFGRDLGVQLRSDFPIGPVWFRVAAMMANGEGGFRQRVNLDGEFLYAGRIEVAPLGRMQLSESDLEDSKPQLTAGVSAGYNGALGNELGPADVGAGEKRIEGDVRFWFRGLTLRGEYIHGFRDDTESAAGYERYAASAQIGYVLPIPIPLPKLEIVTRFSMFDVNGSADGTEGDDYVVDNTETRTLDFGANAYIAKHAAKVSFLYRLTDLLEGPQTDENGDVLIGDTVFVMMQVGWL
ncbi:MAG: hypothetical protein HOW73_33365 [Polyangiaceae bacterium]|nr:hypothetical protein [Polyangiaceae bacterium]